MHRCTYNRIVHLHDWTTTCGAHLGGLWEQGGCWMVKGGTRNQPAQRNSMWFLRPQNPMENEVLIKCVFIYRMSVELRPVPIHQWAPLKQYFRVWIYYILQWCVSMCMFLHVFMYECLWMYVCMQERMYLWMMTQKGEHLNVIKKKFTGPTNGPSTLPAPSHHPTHKTPNFCAPDLEYWLQLYPPSDWTPIFSELSILHCQIYRYPNPFRMIIGPSLIHPKTVPSHKHPRWDPEGRNYSPCKTMQYSISLI